MNWLGIENGKSSTSCLSAVGWVQADHRPRRLVWAAAGSLLITVVLVVGNAISNDNVDTIKFNLSSPLRVLLLFFVLLVLAYGILCLVDRRGRRKTPPIEKSFSARAFYFAWVALLLLWQPVFLAYYPTIWAYDVMSQVPLESGSSFNALHPLLHTLYIQGCISIGKALGGGYELGMVILSFIQMIVMAGIFAYTFEKLRARGVPLVPCLALIVFFGLMPFNSVLAISQTKDVMFSGLGLMLFLLHSEVIAERDCTRRQWLVIVAIGALVIMLRNNALYAAVVWVLISALAPGRRRRLRLTVAMISSILLATTVNATLSWGLNAVKGPSEEALSVPFQCLTRIAVLHDEYVPEYGADNLMFDGLVLRDEFPKVFASAYSPHNADSPKASWIRSDSKTGGLNVTGVLTEWGRMTVRHPVESVTAWALLVKGAWYPFDTSHAHVYDASQLERQGYLLTDFKQVKGMDSFRPDSKFPWLEGVLEKVATDNVQYDNPITTPLFCPAAYGWLLLLVVWLSSYKRRSLFPYLFVLLYWGTTLLAPLIVVRYMYLIMLVAPVALVLELFCVPRVSGNAIEGGD